MRKLILKEKLAQFHHTFIVKLFNSHTNSGADLYDCSTFTVSCFHYVKDKKTFSMKGKYYIF